MTTKQGSRAEVNSFIQGLITEASPLNFPANASVDEENFELNRDGTRDRRLGMDLEDGYTYRPTTLTSLTDTKINTYKWYSVAGDNSDEFLVVQIGRSLEFFDLAKDPLSSTGFINHVEISEFSPGVRYSFASVEGKLVVASGADAVAVVSYNRFLNTFTYELIRLKVRDMWGVQEAISQYETDTSYRGVTLDNTHTYNLQNQSWGIPRKDKAGNLANPISVYIGELFKVPSNSEVVWTGLQFQPIVTTGTSTADPYERIYTNLYTEVLGADINAAKGYYIIDVLRRGQSRSSAFIANSAKYPEIGWSGISIPVDYTPGGAKIVAEFSGRIFYTGFSGEVAGGDARSPTLSNYVLFSQLVKNTNDLSKCYQEGDPTSRENSDIVDTDGGFLRVSGAKRIISLQNIGSHLIVIADNGVWAITGGGDYGFSATNYKVSTISTYGCLSDSSIVVDGGKVFFWSEDGIYVIGRDQFGELTVNSITQTTIQTLYESIPNISKESSVGVYDPFSKKIRWLYKTGTLFTTSSVTKELVLDTVLSAFYQNRLMNLGDNSLELLSMFPAAAFRKGETFDGVVVGEDSVVVVSDTVGITTTIRSSGTQSIRYLVVKKGVGSIAFTFSTYNNVKFLDWEEVDGVGIDAKAFLTTGAQTAGDSAIAKQIPYLIMHFRRTEEGVDTFGVPLKQSSCLVRSQWDWANTANSRKWSSLFQAYRYRRPLLSVGPSDLYDNGFETVVSKSKLRGRGKAFAMYLETEPEKDCRILGWSLTVNGNTVT